MYVLHYAPDNASLIIRLALEHRGLKYRCVLVDRAAQAQRSAAYLALNPNGLIPALETPDGVIFETGAILLWLADRHGGLGPAPMDPDRGTFLKWLFFVSNTIHPALRSMFYPQVYIVAEHVDALRAGASRKLAEHFAILDQNTPTFLRETPGVLDFYIAACLRWSAVYPTGYDKSWFDLTRYPALHDMCLRLEALPCVSQLQHAEGLGLCPFTRPAPPNPPEGSAT